MELVLKFRALLTPQLLHTPQNFTSSKFCSDIQILLELIKKARSKVGTYTTTINDYGFHFVDPNLQRMKEYRDFSFKIFDPTLPPRPFDILQGQTLHAVLGSDSHAHIGPIDFVR